MTRLPAEQTGGCQQAVRLHPAASEVTSLGLWETVNACGTSLPHAQKIVIAMYQDTPRLEPVSSGGTGLGALRGLVNSEGRSPLLEVTLLPKLVGMTGSR